MLRGFILGRIDGFEKQLGVSLDYLRYMVEHSLGAFFKFSKVMPAAAYRKAIPPEAQHVAALVASRAADCGTCVQIGVNLARKDGVSREIIQNVLDERPDLLPEELGVVYKFTEGVVTASGDEDLYRDKIREKWGHAGLIDVGMAITFSRTFPTMKRALGYAKSCSQVTVKV